VLRCHYGGVDEDELYGLALDRFIAERGALVRTLRADGDREQAGQVAGLRKPSVAAWAVNQLVRTQGELLAELFAAGDALRAAQGELLAVRGDGRALRAAAERKRSALLRLTSAARRTLSREGDELSGPVVERVGETLHAAAVDEWARAQVSAGRLERELRHAGLGLEGAGARPSRRAAEPKQPQRGGRGDARPRRQPSAVTETREQEGSRPAKPAQADRERAQARRAGQAALTEARRRAERASRKLELAEKRREQAAEALTNAEQALAVARAEVDSSASELQPAHQHAEGL
jgi:hypothetical protein